MLRELEFQALRLVGSGGCCRRGTGARAILDFGKLKRTKSFSFMDRADMLC